MGDVVLGAGSDRLPRFVIDGAVAAGRLLDGAAGAERGDLQRVFRGADLPFGGTGRTANRQDNTQSQNRAAMVVFSFSQLVRYQFSGSFRP